MSDDAPRLTAQERSRLQGIVPLCRRAIRLLGDVEPWDTAAKDEDERLHRLAVRYAHDRGGRGVREVHPAHRPAGALDEAWPFVHFHAGRRFRNRLAHRAPSAVADRDVYDAVTLDLARCTEAARELLANG